MPIVKQEQEILDHYATFEAPPIPRLSPENARNLPTLNNAVKDLVARNMARRMSGVVKPMPEPAAAIRHLLIPGSDGDILARLHIPAGEGPFPVLVYFHGGGWVIANLDTCEPSARALCNAAECIVVSVAYRQSPEYKFPVAVQRRSTGSEASATTPRSRRPDRMSESVREHRRKYPRRHRYGVKSLWQCSCDTCGA